ncbi:MAG: GtrA family protein [Candidatus Saccharibacteria bacterium]
MDQLIKKHADKIRFLAVGGINTAIDFIVLFSLFNLLGWPVFFSNIISTTVALVFSFYANKTFTFNDKSTNIKAKAASFVAITIFGLWILQPIIIAITKSILGEFVLNDNIILAIGKIAATCVTLVWNYLMYRRFVFKSEPEIKKQSEK